MSDAALSHDAGRNPDCPRPRRWRQRLRSLLPWAAAAYLLAAFVATHLTMPGGFTVGQTHADKLVHATIFGGLSLLIAAWRITRFDSPRRAAAISFVLCLIYGVGDEVSQLLVVGRDADGWDLLADTCGTLIGLAAFAPLLRWRRQYA